MKLCIFIVEDEFVIVDNLVYVLEIEGFECCWCVIGGEGLRVLEDVVGFLVIGVCPEYFGLGFGFLGFDLVVFVVGLLDMGGFDLCWVILWCMVCSDVLLVLVICFVEDVGVYFFLLWYDEDCRCLDYFGKVLELLCNEYCLLLVFLEKLGWVWIWE